ncbi:MAG: radical SAM protein [Alphaproteobacteria bacterium]|nr:radical SAM protein [Alphaproteobacteria bacterium]
MIRNATFSITNRCNSRCRICNIWKISDFSDELSVSEIGDLFSKPFFESLDTISITGGEPFLRDDLKDIICLINKKCPNVRRIFLNTNASFPAKALKICELCTSLFDETILSVSLDGREPIHNELRGVNNYHNVISLVEQASGIENVKVSLSMTLSDRNCTVEDLQYVRELAKKYSAMFSFRFADTSEFYYRNSELSLTVSDEKKKMVAEFIKENCQDNEFLQILREYIENGKIPLLIDEQGKNRCLAGREFVFIHPNGAVSPCLYSSRTINTLHYRAEKIRLGEKEKCPCCTDCAIYPIIEYQKRKLKKEDKC